MILAANTKWVMIGDSITDAGRSESGEATPWAPQEGFGHGYVNLVNAHIQAAHPEKNIRIINRGIDGNTIRDLKTRWADDVIALQPDWLSVMIGINDVWRQCDTPLQTEGQVDLDEFEQTYSELLSAIRPNLKGLILASPYCIEDNAADFMRAKMDRYGAVVKKLAEKFEAIHVDVQPAFNQHLETRHSASLAWDRIHPNTTGHLIIAQEFLTAIDL